MTPTRPRTCPGVYQDHRPSFYDDPPPSTGSGDFLASEQPAPLMNPLRSLPHPQAALDRHVVHAEGPASSKLCPPARGQRITSLRAIAATTSPRSFTDAIFCDRPITDAIFCDRPTTDAIFNDRPMALRSHYCYCYPGADTERYATAIALETLRSHRDSSYPEPVCVHHAGHPPMTLEPRLLELK
ncbi:hypothetical protein THAOC_03157 [Thalassiosira oceanica]|uniref:Uncharacterized protein n=1 Tax=Thalassiosira oceanica TaxID=159749 RepID=K0TPZ0_THAOC|nr:hypothetical protein THAOC_03157 [Thalassiosira oceanica]|eukprot:EJK75132.1 hypothetical protein THAOC_03157 [Thalassiosira oceanica]